jgi:hypothetical protein
MSANIKYEPQTRHQHLGSEPGQVLPYCIQGTFFAERKSLHL